MMTEESDQAGLIALLVADNPLLQNVLLPENDKSFEEYRFILLNLNEEDVRSKTNT